MTEKTKTDCGQCSFKDELETKYLLFDVNVGPDQWEALCAVCKAFVFVEIKKKPQTNTSENVVRYRLGLHF